MSAYFRIFFEILLSSPGNPFTFLEPFFRWCWSCSLQTPMLSGIASEVSFLFQSRDLHTRLSVLKEVKCQHRPKVPEEPEPKTRAKAKAKPREKKEACKAYA